MSRRIVIEEPCEHGEHNAHLADTNRGVDSWCPGGSRIVLEGIPDEWVERGRVALDSLVVVNLNEYSRLALTKGILVAAVFGETP